MSTSFAKSKFGKPANPHRLKWAFAKAVIAGLALNAMYQQYTPDDWKDKVGQKVEQVTGSELAGEFMGHKAAVVVPAQQPAPKPPGQ
ncbi:MAG TPA: hypothetical protein VEF76_00490 [Patescibacteria group bacterium]|nr:hypothetical protein [Patescibacteria group bacterium]